MNRRTFLKMTSAAAGAALSDGIIPNPPHAEITDPALAEEAFGTDLFRDDFSRLPPGWLSRPVGQLYGAIQQHHYLATCGVSHGPWANAICHLDAWIVGDEDGNPYLICQVLLEVRISTWTPGSWAMKMEILTSSSTWQMSNPGR